MSLFGADGHQCFMLENMAQKSDSGQIQVQLHLENTMSVVNADRFCCFETFHVWGKIQSHYRFRYSCI